jgi:penicillin amidase
MRRYWLLLLIAVLAAVLLTASLLLWGVTRRGLPRTGGVIEAAVSAEVEIYRDTFGVPHIIARSVDDLFYAQGYVQAQDRLWQMDLLRRGVSGRLSAIFGEGYADTDRFSLTVGFYRAARAGYAALGPEAKAALEAYARGVNGYIEDNWGRLSPEFALCGYLPDPWEPVDSLAVGKYMAWYLGGNMAGELFFSALLEKVSEEKALELFPVSPETGSLMDPALREETVFSPGDIPALLHLSGLAAMGGLAVDLPGLGSNGWAVSGSKTRSGAALLANDIHLGLGIPSIWYENHLILEGEFNAAGVTFPGYPGVVAGFTGQIAWGMTNIGADVQDLFLIEFNPDNPHQYRYQDGWADATVLFEEFTVKGEAEPRRVEVIITRHGPVISIVAGLEKPLSLRWTGLEATLELEAVLGLLRAADWADFCAALEGYMAPAQYFVFADRRGNIGYRAAGYIPIRRGGSGLLPAEGSTGAFDWEGYIPWPELPQSYNPPEGIIVTANHNVAGGDYPYLISAEWTTPYRALGIWRELEGREALTLADMTRAQNSFYNTQAALLAPVLLKALAAADLTPPEEAAFNLLREWLHAPVEAPGAAGPLIYNALYLKMLEHTFASAMGEALYRRFLSSRGLHGSFDRILLEGRSAWLNGSGGGGAEPGAAMIAAAFRDAVAELAGKLGEDASRWRWGDLHTVTFRHQLGTRKLLERFVNRGPFPVGGSGNAPAGMAYPLAEPFGVTLGPAWRFSVDLADYSAAGILAGGSSGHPFSPHYDDQLALWLNGEYREMLFDPAALRKLGQKLVLRPRPR